MRVRCAGLEVTKAIRLTLENGRHCIHPELIPEDTLTRIQKEVEDLLQELEKGNARRGGKRTAG